MQAAVSGLVESALRLYGGLKLALGPFGLLAPVVVFVAAVVLQAVTLRITAWALSRKLAGKRAGQGERPEPMAYLSDSVLSSSLFFKFWKAVTLPFARWFWALRVQGVENAPRDSGALFVALHTTHSHDIFTGIFAVEELTGKVTRSLVHRMVCDWLPLIRYLGTVPGYKNTAATLLKSGYWVAVIPGGVEEALQGFEGAYQVNWPENRVGFAHVIKEAKVPIVPVFIENGEEMKFNVVLWLWNLLRLHRIGWAATRLPVLGPVFFKIGIVSWFLISWFALPICVPVPVTVHIGRPLIFDYERASPSEIREVTTTALKSMLATHQPGRKSYLRALRSRFWPAAQTPAAAATSQ
eukprot:c47132_g1_i1.p1 GENE.c47132_g1_i1~~c47132_g1_i1.p1  ORF type:complete len:353 (+),score=55.15 c47132_g1_i1:1-1059(+)